jgi:hypothetical protein
MAISFIDPESGKPTGSSELGKAVLSAAVESENSALSAKISAENNWRKNYQSLFAQVAMCEFGTGSSALSVANAGLAEFERRVVTENGETLISVIQNAWRAKRTPVVTVAIKGTGVLSSPSIDQLELKAMVANHSAEPGIVEALSSLDHSEIKKNLFIALAGGAEYSPTRLWLDWGGDVAIVARNRKELWLELIARARAGVGTLYVPVLESRLMKNKNASALSDGDLAEIAGLDLVEDYAAITSWIASLARVDSRRIVLGNYAYAPGAKHIQVQAVQHCISRTLTEALPKTRVVLSWLATPTDSHAVPAEFALEIARRFNARSSGTRLRDLFFGARQHLPEIFESADKNVFALIDPTSNMQGSSYALAKRLQRWLAYQQASSDRQVAYLVAPPARTESVLSHRILRATYRGAPHFGLYPYETDLAVKLSALLLLSKLQEAKKPLGKDLTQIYTQLAVHGGLWRSIYNPSDLWRVATIRGIWGYFSKR